MEIFKITHLKHSGIGKNATHLKVIEQFEKSKNDGLIYCSKRGWNVKEYNNCFTISSGAMFGFEMTFLAN